MSARMFPEHLTAEVRADPGRGAEVRVYQALERSLDESFAVFHSVPWLARTRNGAVRDGEADFVVLHEKLGLLVLEVKGGAIDHDPRSGKWHSTTASGRGTRYEIKDPYDQAHKSKYELLELLKKTPGLEGMSIPYSHAVVFPDSHRQAVFTGPGFDEITAFSGDMTDLGRFVSDVMNNVSEKRGNLLSPRERHQVEQFLGRSFKLLISVSARAIESEQVIIELSERQLETLSILRRRRRVEITGGAGTGKTMLAKEVARRLSREGLRVLWVCYNRPLRDEVADELSEFSSIRVQTFHQLCEASAKSAGIALPPSNSAGYFDDALPLALLEALAGTGVPRYDAVIVDEAQDLDPSWWDCLIECLEDPAGGVVYSFRDDNQRIYRESASLPGAESFPLDRNLRNTRQIHALARDLYKGSLYESGDVGGLAPDFREATAEGLKHDLQAAIETLVDSGFEASQVVVLTCEGRQTSSVPTGKLGPVTLAWLNERRRDVVTVETVRRFKGLESMVVVLVELGPIFQNDHGIELAYVALTRARSHLVVIGSPLELRKLKKLGTSAS